MKYKQKMATSIIHETSTQYGNPCSAAPKYMYD